MARILIVLFAATLPLYLVRFQIGPLPTTLLELLFVVLIVTLFLERAGVGGAPCLPAGRRPLRLDLKRLQPWLWPCGLLLVAGVIGVAVAPDLRAALGLFRAYLIEPLLFFGVLISVTDETVRRNVGRGLALSGAIVAAAALLQFLVAPQTLWEGTRATAFYPFPNAIGLFLGPIVVLAAGMALASTPSVLPLRKGEKLVLFSAAFLMFAAIVTAQSEGAIVGVAAGVVVLGLLHAKTRRATIVTAVVAAVLIMIIPATRNLAAEKLLLRDWSGTVRRITWGETIEMLKDRPLTGAGLAGYPIVMRAYHKATAIEIFQYPHQIVLNIWSELGLLGLVAFGWILITFFRLAGRDESRPYGQIAIAAMIALLVHGLVDVPYFKNDLAFLFWIIVALGTAGSPRLAQARSGQALPKTKSPLP
ncbi:MAG: O-antigen ligase family protein [Patescibacteria group bacterium]